MVNRNRKRSDETMREMRQLYEGYTATWAIAHEYGLKEKSLKALAHYWGWKRPADFLARHFEAETFQPSGKKEEWFRAAWNDGTEMVEMEAMLGVSACTIRHAAARMGLGPRNRDAICEQRRERNGHAGRARLAQRLWNNSDLTPEEIADELGISRLGLRDLVRRRRKAGEAFKPKMQRGIFRDDDAPVLRDAFRLGIGLPTLARILSDGTRIVTPQIAHNWGRKLQLRHRNSAPQMLRNLAPELLWAYSEVTWNDPADLVQKAWRISRELTAKQALGTLRDYHEALDRFPQIPALMAAATSKFWFREIKTIRPAHPAIEALRESDAIVHDRKRRQ